MAKTHLSLSHDPTAVNRPTGWRLPVRGMVPSAGAGSWSCCAATCSGCPASAGRPAYMNVDIDADGRTVGLF